MNKIIGVVYGFWEKLSEELNGKCETGEHWNEQYARDSGYYGERWVCECSLCEPIIISYHVIY